MTQCKRVRYKLCQQLKFEKDTNYVFSKKKDTTSYLEIIYSGYQQKCDNANITYIWLKYYFLIDMIISKPPYRQ